MIINSNIINAQHQTDIILPQPVQIGIGARQRRRIDNRRHIPLFAFFPFPSRVGLILFRALQTLQQRLGQLRTPLGSK